MSRDMDKVWEWLLEHVEIDFEIDDGDVIISLRLKIGDIIKADWLEESD